MFLIRDKNTGKVIENIDPTYKDNIISGEVVLGKGEVVICIRKTENGGCLVFQECKKAWKIGEELEGEYYDLIQSSLVIWVEKLESAMVLKDKVDELVNVLVQENVKNRIK